MLWQSEGTYNAANPAAMYRTIYGGEVLPDTPATWAKHPNRKVTKWGKTSSAFGAYQFTYSSWMEMVALLKLPDITPISQDRGFVRKLQQIPWGFSGKVYDALIADKFDKAIAGAKSEWTSLPGGIHQRKSLAEVRGFYLSAGGTTL